MSMVEDLAAAASEPAGLAYPPASGAEPEYYGELHGQSCGVSLRGPAQGGRTDEGYPENHSAGGLVHFPRLKSLRRHTHREWMSIASRDEKHNLSRET